MQKLNQVIAVEKGIKSKVTSEVSEAYKTAQKPNLFEGFTKEYQRLQEDGEQFPPESKRVQQRYTELLQSFTTQQATLMDVTASKDYANCTARASVEVDGTVLIKDAPVTYLLFLEKQLNDFHTFVSALPVLDRKTGFLMRMQAYIRAESP